MLLWNYEKSYENDSNVEYLFPLPFINSLVNAGFNIITKYSQFFCTENQKRIIIFNAVLYQSVKCFDKKIYQCVSDLS